MAKPHSLTTPSIRQTEQSARNAESLDFTFPSRIRSTDEIDSGITLELRVRNAKLHPNVATRFYFTGAFVELHFISGDGQKNLFFRHLPSQDHVLFN